MNFTSAKKAIERGLKMVGTSCKLSKAGGGGEATTIGAMLSSTSKDKPDSFVSSNARVVYISGKVNLVPEEGDTITFIGNVYAINEVTAYAVGEGAKNVFAYKLTVGTA